MSDNSDNSDREKAEQTVRLQETLSLIKNKYLVMGGKGGVGKSTVAVNLAVYLSNKGHAVGLMDIDLHGPDTLKMIGLDSTPLSVDSKKIVPLCYNDNMRAVSIASMLQSPDIPVIWRGPMKFSVIRQLIAEATWGKLYFLIIDSPPGTGDEPLTIAQQISGAKSIIVTTPQAVSILDVRKSINFCRQLSMPVLGLIENMSGMICPFCGNTIAIFGSGGGRETARDMGIPFLGSVPIDPEISKSGDAGKPYILMHPDSPASRAIYHIAEGVSDERST